MRILFNEDFTEMAMLWEISRYGLVTISTVENECLGLGCNGAFPLFRIRVDTPHIELIIECRKLQRHIYRDEKDNLPSLNCPSSSPAPELQLGM